MLLGVHLPAPMNGPAVPGAQRLHGKVFVEVTGDLRWPGVYVFDRSPGVCEALKTAGVDLDTIRGARAAEVPCRSGSRIDLTRDGTGARLSFGELSAHRKVTLGIPLSLNTEPAEGLTAVPGIGPARADAIVRERVMRGGFRTVDEIYSIKGIGPSLGRKLIPYLVLQEDGRETVP